MRREGGLGPATIRVGRFIGKLGVVSLPAVEVGLDLDERVVRRHVAKLEAGGGLGRAAWIWGEGSVVWLTASGLRATGLGGLRAVKAPPAPTTVALGVLVAWSAARAERRRLRWASARELALESNQWAALIRDERGYRNQLPDLAVWGTRFKLPVAVIGETGHRRYDRQRRILEGWRDAIWSGQYAAVRYDCASASVAARISRLAEKVNLTGPAFMAAAQSTAEEIAGIGYAAGVGQPAPGGAGVSESAGRNRHGDADERAVHRRSSGPRSSRKARRDGCGLLTW